MIRLATVALVSVVSVCCAWLLLKALSILLFSIGIGLCVVVNLRNFVTCSVRHSRNSAFPDSFFASCALFEVSCVTRILFVFLGRAVSFVYILFATVVKVVEVWVSTLSWRAL